MIHTTKKERQGSPSRPQRRLRNRLLAGMILCLLWCFLLASPPASAFSGRQTDQAFAALLSMPGAGPEQGTWDFPPAEDFEVKSEPALIAYIAKKRKAGADLNAYRHLGTLLHHAIRAGQVATAKWLLSNGADPRKKVLAGGQDALGLAETYKRSELVQLLQTQHGMGLAQRPSAPAPVPSNAPAEAQGTPRDQLYAMVRWLGREVRNRKVTATYKTPPETWRAFWRTQSKPIDYPSGFGWAAGIQPELWPELFASGYQDRQAETALGCLLNDISADEFKQLWPRLETHFTDIRQVAPRMILRAYLLAPGRYTCEANPDEANAKLQFLTQLGIHATVNALLARELARAPAGLLQAMEPFTRTTFPKPGGIQPRVVQIRPGCKANLTAALYRELATAAVVPQNGEPYARVTIETVQWIDVPGQADCALLVGGFSREEPYVSGVADSFTGPEVNPRASCPDPTDRYEVWNPRGQQIQRLPTNMGQDGGEPGLIPVVDQATGKRYALHLGEQQGQCHSPGRPPFLLSWQPAAVGLAFNTVESAELDNALYWQCRTKEGEGTQCQGIPAMQSNPQAPERPPKPEDAYDGMDLDSFLKTLRAGHFDRYQAAVFTLHKTTLKALQAEGIPASWTAQALVQLGKSSLSLAEKRRRIAWLFVDRAQLRRSLDWSYSVAESLIDWLPLQDWRPVLEILGEDRRGGFDRGSLRREAEDKGRKNLACAIDNAQGFLCGETIDASR
jgi:hypothetical protein